MDSKNTEFCGRRCVPFAGAIGSRWVILAAVGVLSLASCSTDTVQGPSTREGQATPQRIGNVVQGLGETCDALTPCGECEVCDMPDAGADAGPGTCVADVGAACGDPTTTECNGADTCNSAGVCLDNFVTVTTPCGDPTNTTCDGADTCNGAGVCLDNLAAAAVACGDPTATDCDNADTCDGAGVCQDNLAAATTACGDSTATVCNGADTCSGTGVCQSNLFVGTPCGDPTVAICNGADTCGAGICQDNVTVPCIVDAGTDAGDAAADDAGDGAIDATVPDAAAGGAGGGAGGSGGASGSAGNGGSSGNGGNPSNGGNPGSNADSGVMDAGLDAGGAGGTDDDSEDCSCTVPGQSRTNGPTLWAFTLLGLSLLWRRRTAGALQGH